jgi:nucleotidyltransferase substrate binding protein (TIGR01987 family)
VAVADIRWKQRFFNFNRAFVLLREAFERGTATLSMLEREGTIQRFEYTFELAWKVLKDYLEEEGALIVPLTPRQVIKDAFAAGILTDGQTWIEMLDQRNLLSHNYNEQVFSKAVDAIAQRYLPALATMHAWFTAKGTP